MGSAPLGESCNIMIVLESVACGENLKLDTENSKTLLTLCQLFMLMFFWQLISLEYQVQGQKVSSVNLVIEMFLAMPPQYFSIKLSILCESLCTFYTSQYNEW